MSRSAIRPGTALACFTAVTWIGCSLITPYDDYRQPAPTDAGPCPTGQKLCNGGCVPANLPQYGCASDSCSRCSVPFAEAVICVEGKCAAGTCQGGHGSCDGNLENGCEADLNTGKTCGNCTIACGGATPFCTPGGQCVQQCPAPLTACGDACVDLQTSEVNCNTCGNKCAGAPNSVPKCVAGKCTVQCNVGFGDCDTTVAGCEELKPFFKDGDNDGFGAGPSIGEGCTAPAGASLLASDCLDTDNRVKPGQTAYFNVGYTNASGKISYDYDCNGIEQATPGVALVDTCSSCVPGGYTSASRSNPPPVFNTFCGSTSYIASCSSSSCAYSGSSSLACR